METITLNLHTVSIVLFIVGLLFLFFGKTSNPIHDIIGFALVIIAFILK